MVGPASAGERVSFFLKQALLDFLERNTTHEAQHRHLCIEHQFAPPRQETPERATRYQATHRDELCLLEAKQQLEALEKLEALARAPVSDALADAHVAEHVGAHRVFQD